MPGDKFMAEKTAMEVQVEYIENEVKQISKKFDNFIIAQDAKLLALSSTFVRADVLAETLKSINKTMDDIGKNYGCLKSQVDEHHTFLPMINDIKKERDSVKFQIMSFAGKAVFWIVAFILGISAIAKK